MTAVRRVPRELYIWQRFGCVPNPAWQHSLRVCIRTTAMMFGRASSRTIQKPEADPGIAIVLCEVLSKGPPEIRRLTVQLVGGNAQLVSKNHLFFTKLGRHFPSRWRLLAARRFSLAGRAVWVVAIQPKRLPGSPRAAVQPRLWDQGWRTGATQP